MLRKSFYAVLLLASSSSLALAGQPYVYPAPPAGFDPMTASNDAVQAYGFPARPAPNDPNYPAWINAVKGEANGAIHRVTPTFKADFHGMKVSHAPMQLPKGSNISEPTVGSTNWSGYATLRQFTPGVQLYDYWVVPTLVLPSVCNGLGAWQGNWKGADGFNNGTVEQAGTLEAIDCSGNQYIPAAWYEDYPNGSVFFANINNGDYVHLVLTLTNTSMSVYFIDYNTFQSWSFNVPFSVIAQLSSVEGIAEAPLVNGQQTVFGPNSSGNWTTYNDYTRNPSTNPTSPTEYIINMLSPYTGKQITSATPTAINLTVYEPEY